MLEQTYYLVEGVFNVLTGVMLYLRLLDLTSTDEAKLAVGESCLIDQ